ncbi:MAG: DegT/DnrJ/EryC1/StrS aminotransferase family [Pseudomonadota bacterium]|jgi:dTDP-4-amino-4,6-dideoxygalactose transaminase
MGFGAGYCPQAEQYFSEAISIPLYPGLTPAQQDQVVVAIKEAVGV